jgi:hypothetical protein
MAQRHGTGLFPREVMNRIPLLPLEEEGRLNDMPLRENFIERVVCLLPLDGDAEERPDARRPGALSHGAQADADGAQPEAIHRDGEAGGPSRDDPLGRIVGDLRSVVHGGAGASGHAPQARQRPAAPDGFPEEPPVQ